MPVSDLFRYMVFVEIDCLISLILSFFVINI